MRSFRTFFSHKPAIWADSSYPCKQHWDDFRALGLDRLRSGDEKGAVRAGGILQAPLVARTEDRSINALAWTELDKEKKPPVNRHKFKQSKDNISSI